MIRLPLQEGAVAAEPLRRASLQEQGEALYRQQTPGDPCREQRTEKTEGMGKQCPAVAGGAGQAMLEPGDHGDGACWNGGSELVA